MIAKYHGTKTTTLNYGTGVPPAKLWGIEGRLGSTFRYRGYYGQRVGKLTPIPGTDLVAGTCPICKRPAFQLDDLAGLWSCSSCERGGNHWTLEYFLSPQGIDWEVCAKTADRLLAEGSSRQFKALNASKDLQYFLSILRMHCQKNPMLDQVQRAISVGLEDPEFVLSTHEAAVALLEENGLGDMCFYANS